MLFASMVSSMTSPMYGYAAPGPRAPVLPAQNQPQGAQSPWPHTTPGQLPWPVAGKARWVVRPDGSHALVLRCARNSSFVAAAVAGSVLGGFAMLPTIGCFVGTDFFPLPVLVAVALVVWVLAIGGTLLVWRVSNKAQDRDDLIIDRFGLRLHSGRQLPWPPSLEYFTRKTKVIEDNFEEPRTSNLFIQRVCLLAPDGAMVDLRALDVIAESESLGIELIQGVLRETWAFGAWLGAVRPLAPVQQPGVQPLPYQYRYQY